MTDETHEPGVDTTLRSPTALWPPWASVRSPEDLGRFVAARRRNLELTQEEVAQGIGVNRRYVHEIENGKDILAYRRLFALLRSLGLDLQIKTLDDATSLRQILDLPAPPDAGEHSTWSENFGEDFIPDDY